MIFHCIVILLFHCCKEQ